MTKELTIANIGPIANATVAFGDLTILVGPQASGKSLFLETFKLAQDRSFILDTLNRYGYVLGRHSRNILNGFYGEGLSTIWRKGASVTLDGQRITRKSLAAETQNSQGETIYYVPAQRILSIDDGRLRQFSEFSYSTPFVLRRFSETLRVFMQHEMGQNNVLFPPRYRLKGDSCKPLNESVFHDARVAMEEQMGQKRMILTVDGGRFPFMTWSAGQKEFMPLLLAFYNLTTSSRLVKQEPYRTIVIEEPEMGLHPQAVVHTILLVCELIQNYNYQVVVSTHSPVFLEFAWALNFLRQQPDKVHRAVCEIFNVSTNSAIGQMLNGLEKRTITTHFFTRRKNDNRVVTHDISSLDAEDNELIADWGGITSFASRLGQIVAKYATQ